MARPLKYAEMYGPAWRKWNEVKRSYQESLLEEPYVSKVVGKRIFFLVGYDEAEIRRKLERRLDQLLSSTLSCAVKVGGSQWAKFPPGNWSLQPVATGAVEEVTNLLKPLV